MHLVDMTVKGVKLCSSGLKTFQSGLLEAELCIILDLDRCFDNEEPVQMDNRSWYQFSYYLYSIRPRTVNSSKVGLQYEKDTESMFVFFKSFVNFYKNHAKEHWLSAFNSFLRNPFFHFLSVNE
ncbi:hypothetical protein AMECASPLE_034054 [Ameca splendens]|uniref:Uncharacterized protein n=1 Tax=Ameca splendens TaxID=208324 RepID=A0ABV0XW82_9TELE